MKLFSFEILVGILAKIETKDLNKNNNSEILMKMPNSNKIFKYIKNFFYVLDFELMKKNNVIDYFNLLYEIIHHNKKILLSEELNMFIYIFFIYIKPHIVMSLLSHNNNIFSIFNYPETKEANENIIYSQLINNNISTNVNTYFIQSLDYLIDNFNKKESEVYNEMFYACDKRDEDKLRIIGFLKEIKEEYEKGTNTNYIKNKMNILLNLDDNNYELSIKNFLEKFKNMFCKNNDNKYIYYNYFYNNLILSIQQLIILNNKTDITYSTLYKILSLSVKEITEENSKKLKNNNFLILKIISCSDIKIKNEEEIYKYIKYTLDFSNYLLDFIQLFQTDMIEIYKLISKLFNNILLIDLDNNFEKYKIVNSNSTIVLLLKLQDILLFLFNKISNYNEIKNSNDINIIINLNKIYEKYQIEKEENSLINKVFIVELENVLPKIIENLNNKEIEIIYECLTNLICSMNHNIRKGAKNILKQFMQMNLISLNNINAK
jgi:hypothetical protein